MKKFLMLVLSCAVMFGSTRSITHAEDYTSTASDSETAIGEPANQEEDTEIEQAPEKYNAELDDFDNQGDYPIALMSYSQSTDTQQTGTGFTYSVKTDGSLTITGYSGSAPSSLVIPSTIDGKTVTEIGDNSFYENFYIWSLTIPDTVVTIGSNAFYRVLLSNIDLGNGVTTIKDSAFLGTEISSIKLPVSLISIGSKAFANTNLSSVILPQNLQSLGKGAFQGTDITTITLPKNLVSIGAGPFYNCNQLKEIIVDSSNTSYTAADGVLFTKDKKELITYPTAKTETSYQVPTGIVKLDDYAFYSSKVQSIILPSSLTTIGEACFYGSSISSLTIPDSVTSIETAAFSECKSLNTITIGTGITKLNDYVFQNSSISSINLAASITDISSLAFFGCTKLNNINVNSANTVYSTQSGVLFSKDGTKLILYPIGKTDTAYTIPNSVTKLGENAFLDAPIQTVTIPASVTEIGEACFARSHLINVTIPTTIKVFGDVVFQDCTSLISADFESEIVSYATFSGCTSLKKVYLGNNVTTLYLRAFYNCTSLSEINFPEKLSIIRVYAFYNCTSLPSTITLPSEMNYVEAGAFEKCTTTVVYPSDLSKQSNGDYLYVVNVIVAGKQYYDMAYQVLDLVNQARTEAGKNALTMDKDLLEAAMVRAVETSVLFEHTRPNGMSCFSYSSKISGENIAAGQRNAAEVMQSWKSSSGHWANIMSSKYQIIGIGCYQDKDGGWYWCQDFGTGNLVNTERRSDTLSNKFTVEINPLDYTLNFLGTNPLKVTVGETKSIVNQLIYKESNWSRATIESESCNYSSSSSGIFSVDQLGIIKGVSAGNAVLTESIKGDRKSYNYNVAVSVDLVVGFVQRLYKTVLLRDPDPDGLNNWVNLLKTKKLSGSEVAYDFFFSDEFKNKNYCDAHFTEYVYNALMGRGSDPAGYENWMGYLYRGTSRESVINGFLLSPEFTAICASYGITRGNGVAVPAHGTVQTGPCTADSNIDTGMGEFVVRLYKVCLGRGYDTAGLKNWITQLNNGESGSAIAHGFFFSPELQNKHLSNGEYVTTLYETMFNRQPDGPGLADWTGQLNRGASRESVYQGFAGSQEWSNTCGTYGITK